MKVSGLTMMYRGFLKRIVTDANLSSDSFRMYLVDGSYSPDLTEHTTKKDLTTAVLEMSLKNSRLTDKDGELVFSFDDAVFEVLGPEKKCRHWVIYDETLADNPLFLCGVLDSEAHRKKKDSVITDGNSLTVTGVGGVWAITYG